MNWIVIYTDGSTQTITCDGSVELEDGMLLFCNRKGDVFQGININLIKEFYKHNQ